LTLSRCGGLALSEDRRTCRGCDEYRDDQDKGGPENVHSGGC